MFREGTFYMCGINGHTKISNTLLIHQMNARNSYRGPDYSGVWTDDFIHLGHNLLTIAGETKNSKQPVKTRDNNNIQFLL